MGGGIGAHHSPTAQTTVWLTPRFILRPLGKFDLDPCAAINQPWRTATRHITEPDDGLTAIWKGRVWLNPPYGRETAAWLKRMAKHGNGIALIFARTETDMFFRYVWEKADGLFFFRKRLHFCYPNGKPAKANAGGPSVLIAYGSENARVLQNVPFDGKYIAL